MKKGNSRITRINEEIRNELSNILRTAKDPRISPFCSVLRVETTTDLKHCKIYFSVLGDEEAQKNTLEGLKSSTGYIKSELARTINLRQTPELQFILDHSIEYGIHMTKLIDEVVKSEGAEE